MNDFDVGARLKELRLRHDLSQRQLADVAGVPHGQISMIETNKSSPSVASLRKILGGLSIGMSEFFEPEDAPDTDIFFTPQQLRDLTSRIYSEAQGLEGKVSLKQVGDARAHNLQILHETYEPGADTGEDMLEHVSTEGGIVVSGEIELTVGDRVAVLKAGDSYLFNSQEPHRFRNIGDRAATVISACTPPYL
ncbi:MULTISPECIES: cupin domain-containing protein [unclassified Meridianimarinicoccus]|uniref:cupin domain-containing protein n=1 Tax=unclassified Meridianimarinicoccus TaxID=2923344 RepID=UPI001865E221|nr:cupin domain-containing protein [Fluviibacterium sp. MJW13]